MVNVKKAAIIGIGAVGASIAFALMEKGIFNELILIDYNKDKADEKLSDLLFFYHASIGFPSASLGVILLIIFFLMRFV